MKRREFITLIGSAAVIPALTQGAKQIPTQAGCLRKERIFRTSAQLV